MACTTCAQPCPVTGCKAKVKYLSPFPLCFVCVERVKARGVNVAELTPEEWKREGEAARAALAEKGAGYCASCGGPSDAPPVLGCQKRTGHVWRTADGKAATYTRLTGYSTGEQVKQSIADPEGLYVGTIDGDRPPAKKQRKSKKQREETPWEAAARQMVAESVPVREGETVANS